MDIKKNIWMVETNNGLRILKENVLKGQPAPFWTFQSENNGRTERDSITFNKTQRFSVDCRCGNTTLWYGTKMLPKTTKL